MADFEIGLTQETLTNIEALTTPLTPPKSSYLPYTQPVKNGDGVKLGMGFPMAVWNFGIATLDQRNQLKDYCDGASASLFIKTKLTDGTYAIFSCIMNWPDEAEEWWMGEKNNLVITFTHLILIPEGS